MPGMFTPAAFSATTAAPSVFALADGYDAGVITEGIKGDRWPWSAIGFTPYATY